MDSFLRKNPTLLGRIFLEIVGNKKFLNGVVFFHHAVVDENLFQAVLRHRSRDGEEFIFVDVLCEFAVDVGLVAVRFEIDHGLLADFSLLHDVVTRHVLDELRIEFLGECAEQVKFVIDVTAVADDTAEAHFAAFGVLCDTLTDVICSVECHHFARSDNVDFLGLAFTNRHGEATAHNVTEHVVEHVIEIFGVSAELFEHADGSDDAAACATHARFRATGFHAAHTLKADLFKVGELDFGLVVANGIEHGFLVEATEQESSRVRLGVATDNENMFTLFYKARSQVLGRSGLADAALTIDSDLT